MDPAATPSEGDQHTIPTKNGRHCSDHEGKELELYCVTCGVLICTWCIVEGEHHDHTCEKIDLAFENYKEEVLPLIDPMKRQIAVIRKSLTRLDASCKEVSDHRAATENSIQATFRRLQEVLNARKTELISELDKLVVPKLDDLTAQSKQTETNLAQLDSSLHFIFESLGAGNRETKQNILMMKRSAIKLVKELTTPLPPDLVEPDSGSSVQFSAAGDMVEDCQNFGGVYSFSSTSADPSQCHVTHTEVAEVGERYTAILQTVDFEGNACQDLEPFKTLKCKVLSDLSGNNCSVERRGHGKYEISYHPTIKGKHRLYIKAEGQYVKGSPFIISVKSRIEAISSPIQTINEAVAPCKVAINQDGDMVLTEQGTQHCVSVFRGKQKLRSFGSQGCEEGQFRIPRGIAVDGEGNIVVADNENSRIQMFTAEGKFIAAVGSEGKGVLQFSHPAGIAICSRYRKVYVADWGNHRVQVLNPDLTFSAVLGSGKKGDSEGEFESPWGVACDSTGKVYIADSFNHRIQVFTPEGKFLRTFGECGRAPGELSHPKDVAIDSNDMVYVSEGANRRVSVFTSEGTFVRTFGEEGEPRIFNVPGGLAIDDCGVVYVCDWDSHNIQCF
jgi:tripartite motif-containing protein 2/3/tripartite motif-containing protein 71